MLRSSRNQLVAVAIAITALATIALWWFSQPPTDIPDTETVEEEMVAVTPTEEPQPTQRTLGHSVEGREIEVYHFGTGETRVLLVGGVHGGYEWNSIILAYQMIDHLEAHPDMIPADLAVDIIPNLNPDGLHLATGLEGRFTVDDITDYSMHQTGVGRFNANAVDLNRNFGCNWAPESSWRGQTVDAGSAPFSEPEAALLRDFVFATTPVAAAFWHSQANAVYASECDDGPLPLTLAIMQAYAQAANYMAIPTFDAYPITGDMEGWLASQGVAAITVELEGRRTPEWTRNLAGTEAMLNTIARELVTE